MLTELSNDFILSSVVDNETGDWGNISFTFLRLSLVWLWRRTGLGQNGNRIGSCNNRNTLNNCLVLSIFFPHIFFLSSFIFLANISHSFYFLWIRIWTCIIQLLRFYKKFRSEEGVFKNLASIFYPQVLSLSHALCLSIKQTYKEWFSFFVFWHLWRIHFEFISITESPTSPSGFKSTLSPVH